MAARPDEWLVIGAVGGGLMQAAAASGVLHSAVDVSHRNMAILVSGPGAAGAINAGCPQDLSLKSFPVGAASRTIFGKIEIVLLRTAEDAFRVEVWRSFADYALGLLAEGARDAALSA
jgi:sarcosine oxidase subunit gamma